MPTTTEVDIRPALVDALIQQICHNIDQLMMRRVNEVTQLGATSEINSRLDDRIAVSLRSNIEPTPNTAEACIQIAQRIHDSLRLATGEGFRVEVQPDFFMADIGYVQIWVEGHMSAYFINRERQRLLNEDMERRNVIGQLVMTNAIARSELLDLYGLDYRDQIRRRMEENRDVAVLEGAQVQNLQGVYNTQNPQQPLAPPTGMNTVARTGLLSLYSAQQQDPQPLVPPAEPKYTEAEWKEKRARELQAKRKEALAMIVPSRMIDLG